MSIIPVGVTVLAAAGLNLLNPILVRPRAIAGFIADVTIVEDHEDELVITHHPVEQGASITDHAYKAPSRLTVRVGYSNSSLLSLGSPFYVNAVYDAFLNLQAQRTPFDVLTGKRAYTNMLIRRLSTRTDQKTENVLELTVEMQEIIITTTQTVSVPPTANMKNASATAPVTNVGTRQLTAPATLPANSTLSPGGSIVPGGGQILGGG